MYRSPPQRLSDRSKNLSHSNKLTPRRMSEIPLPPTLTLKRSPRSFSNTDLLSPRLHHQNTKESEIQSNFKDQTLKSVWNKPVKSAPSRFPDIDEQHPTVSQRHQNENVQQLTQICTRIYTINPMLGEQDLEPNNTENGMYKELMSDASHQFLENANVSSSPLTPKCHYRSSGLFLRCQVESYYDIMVQELYQFEDNLRLASEKVFKDKIHELEMRRKKHKEECEKQLAERLKKVHIEQENNLHINEHQFEKAMMAIQEEYERRERESQKRIQSIIDIAQKKNTEKETTLENERQRRKAGLLESYKKIIEELCQFPFLKKSEGLEIVKQNGLSIDTFINTDDCESYNLNFFEEIIPKLNLVLSEFQKVHENMKLIESQKMHQKILEENEKQQIKDAEKEAKLKAEKLLEPTPKQTDHVIKEPQAPLPRPVSQANLERYQDLLNFKDAFEKPLLEFQQDPSSKDFVFKCSKAINTPVNSIGRSNASHLVDKLDRLKAVLRGHPVKLTDETFCASNHPLGISLCKSLLAKQLLIQGEKVVEAQFKDAFTISWVIVALWDEFPDLGNLFLANIYEACPFLVPYHFTQTEEMTDASYYQKIGYLYKDGGIEDQVKFERRMSGISRLYAAIMISTLPKELVKAGHDHPHGLGNAWRWLTSVLNLLPNNGVTAVIMTNILEVCGYKLFYHYKAHFICLIKLIHSTYIKYLKTVSIERSLFALETVLDEAMKTGTIKQPDGILQSGYL